MTELNETEMLQLRHALELLARRLMLLADETRRSTGPNLLWLGRRRCAKRKLIW